MAEPGMPVWINGEEVTDFPFEWKGEAGKPAVLRDPYGNGIVVPDSRDLRLLRHRQTSRDAGNTGETFGVFTTCWLDHGAAPHDLGGDEARYEYVLMLEASADDLARRAAAPSYRVLQQDHRGHILRHEPTGTTACALFEAEGIVPEGPVRKTDTPVIVTTREQGADLFLGVADPDLRLPKRRNFGFLDEEAAATETKPSVVKLEVRGLWTVNGSTFRLLGHTDGTTLLEVSCRDGFTVEGILNPKT